MSPQRMARQEDTAHGKQGIQPRRGRKGISGVMVQEPPGHQLCPGQRLPWRAGHEDDPDKYTSHFVSECVSVFLRGDLDNYGKISD